MPLATGRLVDAPKLNVKVESMILEVKSELKKNELLKAEKEAKGLSSQLKTIKKDNERMEATIQELTETLEQLEAKDAELLAQKEQATTLEQTLMAVPSPADLLDAALTKLQELEMDWTSFYNANTDQLTDTMRSFHKQQQALEASRLELQTNNSALLSEVVASAVDKTQAHMTKTRYELNILIAQDMLTKLDEIEAVVLGDRDAKAKPTTTTTTTINMNVNAVEGHVVVSATDNEPAQPTPTPTTQSEQRDDCTSPPATHDDTSTPSNTNAHDTDDTHTQREHVGNDVDEQAHEHTNERVVGDGVIGLSNATSNFPNTTSGLSDVTSGLPNATTIEVSVDSPFNNLQTSNEGININETQRNIDLNTHNPT